MPPVDAANPYLEPLGELLEVALERGEVQLLTEALLVAQMALLRTCADDLSAAGLSMMRRVAEATGLNDPGERPH